MLVGELLPQSTKVDYLFLVINGGGRGSLKTSLLYTSAEIMLVTVLGDGVHTLQSRTTRVMILKKEIL